MHSIAPRGIKAKQGHAWELGWEKGKAIGGGGYDIVRIPLWQGLTGTFGDKKTSLLSNTAHL